MSETIKISELTPDPRNANKGSKRGNNMIQESLKDYGAGRSIVVDKHGLIIGGNKTAENAQRVGIEDAIVVESDGSKLVVVKRMDLDLENDPKARMLALIDNRTQEVSLTWDVEQISVMLQDPDIPIESVFSRNELRRLHVPEELLSTDDTPVEPQEIPSRFDVLVECKTEVAQLAMIERLTQEGYTCRSLFA